MNGQAYKHCLDMAQSHYENFPVASLIIPKKARPHIAAVYAFARSADDFADEKEFEKTRMEKLNDFTERVKNLQNSNPSDPVFASLRETILRFKIPLSLFTDLLTAFKMDVTTSRYTTFDKLLHYCRHSANPVGRIVLHIMGYPAPKFFEYSDFICTALQLTNFWQDIAVDLEKNRIYLPEEDLARFGYTETELANKIYNENFRRLILFQVERTMEFFDNGWPLCLKIPGRFGMELRLTWLGGVAILKKIRSGAGDVLTKRPVLKKTDFIPLFLKAVRKTRN